MVFEEIALDREGSSRIGAHRRRLALGLGLMLVNGLPGVISRRFTKSRLWDITRRYGCTMFNLLGGMTTAVYAEPRRPDDAENPVRLVLSAGMPAAIWEDFARRFGVSIIEFYGAAEGGLTINPGNGPIGSCGRPLPNLQLAILDDHHAAPLFDHEHAVVAGGLDHRQRRVQTTHEWLEFDLRGVLGRRDPCRKDDRRRGCRRDGFD